MGYVQVGQVDTSVASGPKEELVDSSSPSIAADVSTEYKEWLAHQNLQMHLI